MKKVILKEQYLHYPVATELTFIDESEADRLIKEGTAKSIDNPPKDKMLRGAKNKGGKYVNQDNRKNT